MKPTADQIDAVLLLSHNERSFCVFLRFENEAELLSAEEAYYARSLSDPFGSRARLISAPDAPCLLMLGAAQSERSSFIAHLLDTWPDNGTLQTWEQAKPLWDAWGARIDAEREAREAERKTAALKAAMTPKGVSVETPAPGETLATVETPVSIETLVPFDAEAVIAWIKRRPAFASREINTMTNEWREPLTEEQLVEYRAWMIELDGDRKFTCDDCNARHRCSLAFDEWNVDGDCLALK